MLTAQDEQEADLETHSQEALREWYFERWQSDAFLKHQLPTARLNTRMTRGKDQEEPKDSVKTEGLH